MHTGPALIVSVAWLVLVRIAAGAAPYLNSQIPAGALPSRYEIIQSTNVVAVHLTHVPGTDKYLYLARATCGEIAGGFDLASRQEFKVGVGDAVFCSGHTLTADGSVIVAGGHLVKMSEQQWKGVKPDALYKFTDGTLSIREYNPRKNPNQLVHLTSMASGRWYPTLTLLPDGQILIMGGTRVPNSKVDKDLNKQFEVFDPASPSGTKAFPIDPIYLAQYKQGYYPLNFVLPTGDVFNYCKRVSRVIIAQTGTYRRNAAGQFIAAADKPGEDIGVYPHSGSLLVLPLRPPYNKVEVMVFGGAKPDNCLDTARPASSKSYRLRITWSQSSPSAKPSYTFSDWEVEEMGIPRVMGDSTILPNGKIVIQNGAQTGCAGDSARAGQARALYPNFWSELYTPDAASGRRYSMMAGSTIARLYHSTAVLTTNGTILISGCDTASPVVTDAPFYSKNPSKQARCEFRNELFHSPFSLTSTAPYIGAVNGQGSPASIVEVGYGEALTVQLSGRGSNIVTDASLVAPSSTTHGINMNQRVVFLSITSNSMGQITLQTPPHPFIAPPQMYMLFLMNGDNYGTAHWVKLVDRTGAGKVLPSL